MTALRDKADALQQRMGNEERYVHPQVYPLHIQLSDMVVGTGMSPVANAQMVTLCAGAAAVGMSGAVLNDADLKAKVHDAEGLAMVIDNLREAADVFELLLAELRGPAN